ncbi:TlpA family protein disulfide reductase [Tepidibacter aestuarii]|uniref:TlpA family protein disulfide reductase n=1 Tax=Tepidibacter aestuarii TaxID=2925782 RepID=UPI0020C01AA3|nr:TlpA disulfide reductase family protein [Tepidibacter aestuarii]CAH2213098.1 cytochrome c biogenesis protein CcmG, thiol:disulfide interchange protein DsbE [Tepidibacter aestuarii]
MNKKLIVIILGIALFVGGIYTFNRQNNIKQDVSNNTVQENTDKENTDKENIDEQSQELAVGKIAPSFTLKDLNGEEVSLSDYEGKIVLINFWATWCGYCDKEMPDLQKLHKENEDLVVLGVDVRESKEKVKSYIDKGNYDFPVLLDEKGETSITYLVSAFPTSYFVDKNGILLGAVQGMMTYDKMNNILEQIRERE